MPIHLEPQQQECAASHSRALSSKWLCNFLCISYFPGATDWLFICQSVCPFSALYLLLTLSFYFLRKLHLVRCDPHGLKLLHGFSLSNLSASAPVAGCFPIMIIHRSNYREKSVAQFILGALGIGCPWGPSQGQLKMRVIDAKHGHLGLFLHAKL